MEPAPSYALLGSLGIAPVLVVVLAIVLLAVVIIVLFLVTRKRGSFPSSHAHANPELQRRGVGCASGEHAR